MPVATSRHANRRPAPPSSALLHRPTRSRAVRHLATTARTRSRRPQASRSTPARESDSLAPAEVRSTSRPQPTPDRAPTSAEEEPTAEGPACATACGRETTGAAADPVADRYRPRQQHHTGTYRHRCQRTTHGEAARGRPPSVTARTSPGSRSDAASGSRGRTTPPPSPTGPPSRSLPNSAGANSSTGQCHRYHEYDSRPIDRIAVSTRTRPTPKSGVAQPAPITSAVPSTGSSAVVPGYGVPSPSCVQVTTIKASPPQPTSAADGPGRCRHAPAVSATKPADRQLPCARRQREKRPRRQVCGPRQRDHERHRGQRPRARSRYGAAERVAAQPGARHSGREAMPCR